MSETERDGGVKRPRGRPQVQEGGRSAGLNMTMSPKTKAQLEAYAATEGRSVSQTAERLIEEALEGRAKLEQRLGGVEVAPVILRMIETARQVQQRYGAPTDSDLARAVLLYAWQRDAEGLHAPMEDDEYRFTVSELSVLEVVRELQQLSDKTEVPLKVAQGGDWEQVFALVDAMRRDIGPGNWPALDRNAPDGEFQQHITKLGHAYFAEGAADELLTNLVEAAIVARSLSGAVRSRRLKRRFAAIAFEAARTKQINGDQAGNGES